MVERAGRVRAVSPFTRARANTTGSSAPRPCALERDERTERKDNARNAPKFMAGNPLVEWNTRATVIRREMTSAYGEFREALRQSPAAR